MSKWSGKVIKGATVKLGIRHKLTHFDYLLLKKLVCGKKNWQKERGAVCEARLLPSLTAHVPTTNPMFFPCSCHHLHTENPRALTLTAVQRLPY